MTLVETDTRYKVTLHVYRCKCGKQAVTTGAYHVPPTCDCKRVRR